MGMLVDGGWRSEAKQEDHDVDSFDSRIGKNSEPEFEPEKDRYRLYISRACPWAHRAALVRRLRGLEDVISMDIVDPVRKDEGWEFSPEKEGCTQDSYRNADYLREIYQAADPDYTGRVTVPVLWDKKQETIVNNESEDIARMLNRSFDQLGNDVDLYPEEKHPEIDSMIREVFQKVNSGVYKAGFAETQDEYEKAVEELFDKLDELDTRLGKQRFLHGDRMTLSDVFLFPTLFRFDAVYHTHFKCNIRKLTEFDNLWQYTRDIYQIGEVDRTCNIGHVKKHYYVSHKDINPKGFVPVGPALNFTENHARSKKSGTEDIFLEIEERTL